MKTESRCKRWLGWTRPGRAEPGLVLGVSADVAHGQCLLGVTNNAIKESNQARRHLLCSTSQPAVKIPHLYPGRTKQKNPMFPLPQTAAVNRRRRMKRQTCRWWHQPAAVGTVNVEDNRDFSVQMTRALRNLRMGVVLTSQNKKKKKSSTPPVGKWNLL